jgi:myo-inositol-1(or 4)-monophosphatase
MAYVAAGRYEGFWERGLKAWDLAAGVILVKEAGGFVEPLTLGGSYLRDGEVICGSAALFDPFSKAIRG